ncbi:mitochondrial ribosomal protein-like protein subunit L31 [Xylogone sp. PMI_703]|nr:mitochondrial ribosomal protein-like protein subunit L31 [Xylogone sp. PMI_703]
MFGAFRSTSPLSGGLLWLVCYTIIIHPAGAITEIQLQCRKIPWRLSKFQKARQRRRLRAVDTVVAVVDQALAKQGLTTKAIQRWKEEMPTEQEMLPKDKYTMFDRKEKKYRKGIHKLPKWTRLSQRVNPPGY